MPELVVSLKGRELSRHPLGVFTRVGRDPAMDVVIDNPGVSRHHVSIAYEDGKYVIRDEKSQNGMFHAEQRIYKRVLAEGDVIQLGKFGLSFHELGAAPKPKEESPPSLGARSPGMVKTFALKPMEVQSMLAAHAAKAAAEPEAPPRSSSFPPWSIAAVVALVALVVVVGLVVLR
ncbi:MAG TPA: FHA domain-containing protein [Polyangiaceae bacterium]|jgi:predicted component of type VI protein secretion system|nr:FHA domain-containing protein [Polyangiaceae bacterium]